MYQIETLIGAILIQDEEWKKFKFVVNNNLPHFTTQSGVLVIMDKVVAARKVEDKVVEPPKKDDFSCPHCDFTAKNQLGLSSHIRHRHETDQI